MTTLPKKYPEFIIGFEFEGYVKNREEYSLTNEVENPYYIFSNELLAINKHIDVGGDGSIEPPDGGITYDYIPVEIRTPALPIKEGLVLLDKMLTFFENKKRKRVWGTNETCGLHINISEKNVFKDCYDEDYVTEASKKFYLRILQKFHQKRILRMFGRLYNNYCNPVPIKKSWRENFKELYKHSEYFNICEKYHAVAHRGERIEFRCLGNKNYELKRDKIKSTIKHIQTCALKAYVECANDPQLDEKF